MPDDTTVALVADTLADRLNQPGGRVDTVVALNAMLDEVADLPLALAFVATTSMLRVLIAKFPDGARESAAFLVGQIVLPRSLQ